MPHCAVSSRKAFARASAGELPTRITWWHASRLSLPGLGRDDTEQVIAAAFCLAELYVPLDFVRVARRGQALIQLEIGPDEEFEDSDAVAMADCVSLRDDAPRSVWFSPIAEWGMRSAELEIVPALPVTCHEIGHCLGFGHSQKGLMQPYYDPLVTTPTRTELKRFYREYPQLKQLR